MLSRILAEEGLTKKARRVLELRFVPGQDWDRAVTEAAPGTIILGLGDFHATAVEGGYAYKEVGGDVSLVRINLMTGTHLKTKIPSKTMEVLRSL